MYQQIYRSYQSLNPGQQADLKCASRAAIGDLPAYFHLLKRCDAKDNLQTQRIIFLLAGLKINKEQGDSVAKALLKASVKETAIIQITRGGDNSIDYFKRQLRRCNNIDLNSLGKLAQYWGDNARRNLLKDFILADNIETEEEQRTAALDA